MSKSLKQMAYDTIEAHQETIADLRTQLEKANESYKELFSAFESCQGELKKANERVKALDEIADTAFKYNHSSAECLRAWTKLQQLRKEQDK
ncbi:hypothetical protein [Alteromonas macleodii]